MHVRLILHGVTVQLAAVCVTCIQYIMSLKGL